MLYLSSPMGNFYERQVKFLSTKLVNEFDDGYAFDKCWILRRTEASISEAIDEEVPSWGPYDPNMVCAPTGFGKTFFVIHGLIPYVQKIKGLLLLVSNRVASSDQQKQEVAEVLGHPLAGCPGGPWLQRFEDFGSVRVMTLQRLLAVINNEEDQGWIKKVTHLVIDEAHFFTSDFAFNPSTGVLLNLIPQVFSGAVRLYMTATPEDVLLPLIEAEKRVPLPVSEKIRRFYGFAPYELGAPGKRELIVHKFSMAYDHIHLRYFRTEDVLIQAIQATPPKEKWMIFVTSIKKGESLKKELEEKTGIGNVCLITANDKGTPHWLTIVNDEKLPCRVVIATSVLDCGANVNDPALKHMVIHSTQRTEFMQELGRKRCQAGEQFTLYVPVPDRKHLSVVRRQLDRQLEVVKIFRKGSDEDREALFHRLWRGNDPTQKAMVWVNKNHQLCLNRVAALAAGRQLRQLKNLEEMTSIYGDSAFPRLVHQWLEQEDGYDEDFWLGGDMEAKYRCSLMEFLEAHCDKPLADESEQHILRGLIRDLAKFSPDTKLRNEREGNAQYKALNNRLEGLHIPFRIDNDKGVWTPRRCENSDSDIDTNNNC